MGGARGRRRAGGPPITNELLPILRVSNLAMVRSAIDGAVLPDTRCDGVCRLQRVCICGVRICGVLLVLDGRSVRENARGSTAW